MRIVVVDYGSGNLRSAAKALVVAAADAGTDAEVVVTADPAVVRDAARIVMPGQGAFADCLAGIRAIDGLEEALHDAVIERGVPFFGICVGMQLLADQGFEHGTHEGLGWVGGDCVALSVPNPSYKIPHMGWNDLTVTRPEHPVMRDVETGDHVYFVHSYAVTGVAKEYVLATTEYGGAVTAMVGRHNIVGSQFHVEKSQRAGLKLLANFCAWRP